VTYDFSFLWPWLALALLLGAIVGWTTWKHAVESRFFSGWLRWASIAWLVGVVVALLHWIPGRAGFWLETALFFFAAYVLGCLVGGWLKSAVAPEPEKFAEAPAQTAIAAPARPVVSAPLTPASVTPRPVAPPDPPAAGAVEGERDHEGVRPAGFVRPRQGGADDLKRIRGIGPQNEGRLHALGVWHFAQIADWTHDNVLWVGSYLAFPGRIAREEWVAQARVLASGGETAFSQRVEHGDVVYTHENGMRGETNIADLSKIPPRK